MPAGKAAMGRTGATPGKHWCGGRPGGVRSRRKEDAQPERAEQAQEAGRRQNGRAGRTKMRTCRRKAEAEVRLRRSGGADEGLDATGRGRVGRQN